MTLGDIKNQIMFQTNNDEEDIEDFLPHLIDYINDGYDRIVNAWTKNHVPQTDYPPLADDADIPNVPEWMHRYLADWATWLVYRNGNPQKQNRGMAFRESFLSMIAKISDEGGINGLDENGKQKRFLKFINIPK